MAGWRGTKYQFYFQARELAGKNSGRSHYQACDPEKKPKVVPDEYGFSINSNLASAYRDIQLELRALVNAPTYKIPAIAEKIKKLEARSDVIRRRLQVPCPTKYGNKEAGNDWVRLMQFTSLRDNETALTEAQQAEEAHLRARFDVFAASPESIARRRRQALEDAERLFINSSSVGVRSSATRRFSSS